MSRLSDPPGADAQEDAVVTERDPVIERLLPRFVANRRRDVTAILQALKRSEFDQLEEMGHNLKGTGGSYGHEDITEIGQALEEAARSRDSAGIRRQSEALGTYLRGIKISR